MTAASSDYDQLLVDTLREYYEKKDPAEVRADLEQKYGTVWDDKELLTDFGVQFFDGPRVHVITRDNGAHGTVGFIDKPRLYFAFIPDQQKDD
jgi:hypothetical protein